MNGDRYVKGTVEDGLTCSCSAEDAFGSIDYAVGVLQRLGLQRGPLVLQKARCEVIATSSC